ncbi:MAG: hypothetical protein EXR72_05520 [Myxococcales bacterium]|nr:hypothetical protein [Myxococcales bacterium]
MDRFFSPRARAALVVAAISALSATASASITGTIQGTVTDQATGKPLAGVTVTATGPQGEQTEFTDSGGRYVITDLAPGEYVVRFYFSTVHVDRPGVHVQADKTLTVPAAIPTATAKQMTYVIKERAASVDVASTQVQTQITDELVRNTPVGRTFSSILTLAPGSSRDAVGFSFGGATGPENSFLIDGLNTTNPTTGLAGSRLSIEFIGETEIITGGYNAEYGRATGAIVNVITKSGSNEFHGGAWLFYTPLVLDSPLVARPGQAVAFLPHNNTAETGAGHVIDFGFDLGGPIVKDRLFFYGGFTPTYEKATFLRILRRRTAENVDPKSTDDAYLGDLDQSITCPSWLKDQNEALCAPTKAAAFKTEDLDPRFWSRSSTQRLKYDWIGKLNLRINDNNNFSIAYFGGTTDFSTNAVANGNAALGVGAFTAPSVSHDVVAKFTSKLLDRKLQLDFKVGWHYENDEFRPSAIGGQRGRNVDTRANSLQIFEDELEPCKTTKLGEKETIKFNPCPANNYSDQGFGFEDKEVAQRWVAAGSATYFLKAFGTHAIKLGGDFEYNHLDHHRAYTGGGGYTTFDAGTGDPKDVYVLRTQYGSVDAKDPNKFVVHDGVAGRPNGFSANTATLNESVYLRDSWNVGFIPGFTLNAGVRWEAQQAKDINGKTQISIDDNWAPRVGVAYDVLGKGRSKLYASYGRFYESIPMDINDRQFSGEGLVFQVTGPGLAGGCKTDANGRVDVSTCEFPAVKRQDLFGGTFGFVSPKLQGQYSNEVIGGVMFDVGLDIVLGASYQYRNLGRVIEDVSADGGETYVVANPGEPNDPNTIKKLQNQIGALAKQIQGTTDQTKIDDLTKQKNDATKQLALYNTTATFEKPKRDYHALVVTATKRLSNNFIFTASYTYSRTTGNYPGLFSPSNGQLDPNISSQYDLPELLVNRNGPLPNDRPHNVKLIGSYQLPLGWAGGITLGLTFSAQSGTPIEVLGRHPTYGPNETFILPRGSGGRTPPLTTFDARLGYGKTFSKGIKAEVTIDLLNLLNQQQVIAVDQQYAFDAVLPIPDGHYQDLKNLRRTDGRVPNLNPNYGQPTQYQAPLSMRLGARISF